MTPTTPHSSALTFEGLVTAIGQAHAVLAQQATKAVNVSLTLRGNWSVRELKRQIDTQYFERSTLSTNKDRVSQQVHATAEQQPLRLAPCKSWPDRSSMISKSAVIARPLTPVIASAARQSIRARLPVIIRRRAFSRALGAMSKLVNARNSLQLIPAPKP